MKTFCILLLAVQAVRIPGAEKVVRHQNSLVETHSTPFNEGTTPPSDGGEYGYHADDGEYKKEHVAYGVEGAPAKDQDDLSDSIWSIRTLELDPSFPMLAMTIFYMVAMVLVGIYCDI